jgi:two-component system sensor histidine kinase KdpD
VLAGGGRFDESGACSIASSGVKQRWLTARVAASLAVIGTITAVHVLLLRVNPTTVALTYLVAILFIATRWGIAESTLASLLAVVCFNFFFLPPVGTLTIADPQNWVALIAFLLTAIVASQLSGRVRRRSDEAVARQRDLERLYKLSRALLLTSGGTSLLSDMARHIADSFELPAVAMYDQQMDVVAKGGIVDVPDIEARLRDVARRGVPVQDGSALVVVPLQLGSGPMGSLAIAGGALDDTVFQSIANLAAIGLERAASQEMGARAEAARQSGELRATLLDAVAHEFKTPLTSIKAAASDLLESIPTDRREHELAAIVSEESRRLQSLVTDAVQMLRIESGGFAVHRSRHTLRRVVAAALDDMAVQLEGHTVVNRVPAEVTINADGELLQLALRQLLNNAVKYSPATSTIEIDANGHELHELIVRNSGSVIPEAEQQRIFERFYRGATARRVPGTGMGLAIVLQIARAHGGTVTVASTAAMGTEFRLSLPFAEVVS